MAGIHYGILDAEAKALFDQFGLSYQTITDKQNVEWYVVPYDSYYDLYNSLEDKLWEADDDGEGPLWDLYNAIDFDENYWSTESKSWLGV